MEHYFTFVYNLALKTGYSEKDAKNLGELAVFKKTYENIQYSQEYEDKLKKLIQ